MPSDAAFSQMLAKQDLPAKTGGGSPRSCENQEAAGPGLEEDVQGCGKERTRPGTEYQPDGALCGDSHGTFPVAPGNRHWRSHCVREDAEAQGGYVTCPQSHR